MAANLIGDVFSVPDHRLLKPFFDFRKNQDQATSQSYFIEAVLLYLITPFGQKREKKINFAEKKSISQDFFFSFFGKNILQINLQSLTASLVYFGFFVKSKMM